jgi:uncharacterized UPF0160 family protein
MVGSTLTITSLKIIGTHNGTFHCDEALAVYLLRLTEAYADAGTQSAAMSHSLVAHENIPQT